MPFAHLESGPPGPVLWRRFCSTWSRWSPSGCGPRRHIFPWFVWGKCIWAWLWAVTGLPNGLWQEVRCFWQYTSTLFLWPHVRQTASAWSGLWWLCYWGRNAWEARTWPGIWRAFGWKNNKDWSFFFVRAHPDTINVWVQVRKNDKAKVRKPKHNRNIEHVSRKYYLEGKTKGQNKRVNKRVNRRVNKRVNKRVK